MSVQLAMMGAQAGLSVIQGISGALRGAQAQQRQIDSLHLAETQVVTGNEMSKLGSSVTQAQLATQAGQIDITSQEVAIQTAEQELARRRMLASLGQSNTIDLVARGGIETGQDSAGAIDQRNRELSDEDVGNIRLMGDAKQQQLSFRKQNLQSAIGNEELRSTFSQLGTDFKLQNLETQIGTAGQKAQDIGVDAMFNIGSKLLGAGSSMAGIGSSSGGYTTNADMRRTDAEIADWSSYGSR
jgi:hypothetical protein